MSSSLLIGTSGWTRRKRKTIVQRPAALLPDPESERHVDFPLANFMLIKANFKVIRKTAIENFMLVQRHPKQLAYKL